MARLEAAPPAASVERLRLELDGTAPAAGQQLGLFTPQLARAARLDWQLAGLAIRFGPDRLLQARCCDPEARRRGGPLRLAVRRAGVDGPHDPAAGPAARDRGRARTPSASPPSCAGRASGSPSRSATTGASRRPGGGGRCCATTTRSSGRGCWRSSTATASTAPGTSSASMTDGPGHHSTPGETGVECDERSQPTGRRSEQADTSIRDAGPPGDPSRTSLRRRTRAGCDAVRPAIRPHGAGSPRPRRATGASARRRAGRRRTR